MASFEILGINHIGVAPNNVEAAGRFLALLGLAHTGDELVASQKTNTSFFDSQTSPNSEQPRLELLSDDGSGDGPIAKFLEKKGSGIHHIALTVSNLPAAIDCLSEAGVTLIDTKPRPGAHDTQIAFIHPKSTGGILVELVAAKSSE